MAGVTTRAWRGCLLWFSLGIFVLLPGSGARGANLIPPGFEDAKVADAPGVTDIAFTPDGRMLDVTTLGVLSIHLEDGTVVNDYALDFRSKVCSTNDRGFQSVAVDPHFDANHYLYIYYTSNKNGSCDDSTYPNGPVNRLSRFVLTGDTVDPLSEMVLIDDIPSMMLHQGGDTEFGKDGYLYVTVGDGGCDYLRDSGCFSLNNASRDTNTLLGKILRLTPPDGGIPPDNPYRGPNSARCNLTGGTAPGNFCKETYASGLRNPWKLAFDPNASDTRFFINDVGEATWEEIDLGQSGADYGWNLREGPCVTDSLTDCGSAPAGMTDPIYSYDHTADCRAITGGAFVPSGAYRPEDDDAYLYGDFTCGKILELSPSGSGSSFTASELLSGMGADSIAALTFGPYRGGEALYYSSWSTQEIRRLAYTVSDVAEPAQNVTAGASSTVDAGTSAITGPGSGGAAARPALSFADRQTLSRVLQRGLRLRLSLPGPCPCQVRAELLLTRQAARRIGIGRSAYTLLGRSSARARAGVATLTVTLNARAKRMFTRTRRVVVSARVSITDRVHHRHVIARSLRLG